MTATIIFIIIGMLWSYYKKFQKEQDEQQAARLQEKQSRQSVGISEGVSFADLYDIPQGRTDAISEGQTLEWQDTPQEVLEQKPEPPPGSVPIAAPQNDQKHNQAGKKSKPHLLSQPNLMQAIMLSEILSEPRSKRPWKPNRNR